MFYILSIQLSVIFGADSNIEIFAKKAVFISFSALFYNLNFTDSGYR